MRTRTPKTSERGLLRRMLGYPFHLSSERVPQRPTIGAAEFAGRTSLGSVRIISPGVAAQPVAEKTPVEIFEDWADHELAFHLGHMALEVEQAQPSARHPEAGLPRQFGEALDLAHAQADFLRKCWRDSQNGKGETVPEIDEAATALGLTYESVLHYMDFIRRNTD